MYWIHNTFFFGHIIGLDEFETSKMSQTISILPELNIELWNLQFLWVFD